MPSDIGNFRVLLWNTTPYCNGLFSKTSGMFNIYNPSGTGETQIGSAMYKLSGNGDYHNNVPPVIIGYAWIRTA
jgi:hypothetical protein